MQRSSRWPNGSGECCDGPTSWKSGSAERRSSIASVTAGCTSCTPACTRSGTAISRKAELLAATWWCGVDAALADESACAFYRWVTEDADHPPPVHVTTTQCKRSRPGVVVHQTRRLPGTDVLTFERLLRVTDHARTLIDRADHLSYRELRLLADRLRSLLRQRLLENAPPPARPRGLAAHRAPHPLRGCPREVCARATLHRLARRHALRPPDARNVTVAGCEADCAWHDAKVVVELDSRAHHQRRGEMLGDKRRDRRYLLAGWTPVRLMWEELEPDDPAVARQLTRFLER